MADIYLWIEGRQDGPYAEELVRQSLEEGLIPADLPAWKGGLVQWIPVTNLLSPPELPPPFIPTADQAIASPAVQPSIPVRFPWYRSVIVVTLLILLPWLTTSTLALFLKPLSLVGLILILSGPIYYRSRNQTQIVSWSPWLAWSMLGFLAINYAFLVESTLRSSASSPAQRQAILSALHQDNELGQQYEAQKSQITAEGNDGLDQIAQITTELATAMRTIPISNCPSDFQEAYTRHINCWADYGELISQHPYIDSAGEALLEGFVRGLAGDITGGAFEKQDEIDSFLERAKQEDLIINSSWREVQAVALKYGVKPSDY